MRRFLCLVFVQFGAERGNYSIDDIASALWIRWAISAPSYDVEHWKGEVSAMIELGSRYRNIDEHLGFGASFVLGTSLSETIWTKILPKSGKRFDRVMEHLRQVGIPQIAMQMRPTFERVMEFEMIRLKTFVAHHALHIGSELVVGVEDFWSYPLDASLAESDINAPVF
ncbi:Hypothetical protein R9X50_00631400 [Acrodontium crateriforme]|uniref:Uncharacterized protein n=1 Tax=Acrodontium crateriforme TaxID=150365 RepID=A0AAQ3R9S5_9PEZI|nr:Hypothetical protein R9X50_00631400 [Acrodontium crateriforme]